VAARSKGAGEATERNTPRPGEKRINREGLRGKSSHPLRIAGGGAGKRNAGRERLFS